MEGRCPASFGGQTINFASLDVARNVLSESVSENEFIGEPRLLLQGTIVVAWNDTGEGFRIPVRFVARDDFREHITLIAGEHGTGAYVDHIAAEQMQIEPGDTMQFDLQGEPHQIPVAAVYEGVYNSADDDYWCSITSITSTNAFGDLPPPLILVDVETFRNDDEIFSAVYAQYARSLGDWELPVDVSRLTVEGARGASATLFAADEAIHLNSDEIPGFFGNPNLLSDLPLVTDRVVALSDSLRTSIIPLAGVVLVAAVGLVGGAGSYWVDRRRGELEYLSALGAGPGALALKAALEFT